MWKVGQLAKRTGISVRTLHHYDQIGLLTPSHRTESGHRLYDGDEVVVASERAAELLLIGGAPLDEPIARYGPFVMNTVGELRQAMLDYQTGRFGVIADRM